ncbi:apolipo protein O-domain-containing protein [Entophlyctis helioformis]|nr:apolipo protein O-domain-containing protein [Entophlyctis helioformis]
MLAAAAAAAAAPSKALGLGLGVAASLAACAAVVRAEPAQPAQPAQPVATFRVVPKKLSIYDDELPPAAPAPEKPTELELFIRDARHETTKAFASTRQQIQEAVDQWIAVEKQAETVIKRYREPSEDLLPGLLYVTIAGFAGSIVTKNSNILLRLIAPTAGSAAAFTYFFPATSRNIVTQRPAASYPPVQPGDFSPSKMLNDALDKVAATLGVSIPALPSLERLQASLPSLSSLPSLPSLPSMSELPSMPSLASLTSASADPKKDAKPAAAETKDA